MRHEEAIGRARARRTLRSAPGLARALRLEAGLTLAEVGEVFGVSHVAVLRWETGQRTPRGDVAARYLEFLREAAAA
jgi:transcriptional regulator with XRE-family HTH domain